MIAIVSVWTGSKHGPDGLNKRNDSVNNWLQLSVSFTSSLGFVSAWVRSNTETTLPMSDPEASKKRPLYRPDFSRFSRLFRKNWHVYAPQGCPLLREILDPPLFQFMIFLGRIVSSSTIFFAVSAWKIIYAHLLISFPSCLKLSITGCRFRCKLN